MQASLCKITNSENNNYNFWIDATYIAKCYILQNGRKQIWSIIFFIGLNAYTSWDRIYFRDRFPSLLDGFLFSLFFHTWCVKRIRK